MFDEDRLQEIATYVRKTYRWVVVIGVIVILGTVLSFCASLFGSLSLPNRDGREL